jgi:hypothetical protein
MLQADVGRGKVVKGRVHIQLLFDLGAAGFGLALFEGSAAGPFPAAKAMISNADSRPCREGAAAARDADGHGVDHGGAIRRQMRIVKTFAVIPGHRAAMNPESRATTSRFRVRALFAHAPE